MATDQATHCFIGIGSNLQNPLQQVIAAGRALEALVSTIECRRSACYWSDPLGPGEQPRYVNAVAGLVTTSDAETLLTELQAIEQNSGRTRNIRWEPRVLDLDILLFGTEVINTERLSIPHPEMANRNFVLYPLAELEPHLTLPGGETLASLLASCPKTGLERIPSDHIG